MPLPVAPSVGNTAKAFIFTPAYLRKLGVTKANDPTAYNSLVNQPLTYYGNTPTTSAGVSPDTAAAFDEAIRQLALTQPVIAAKMLATIGIPPNQGVKDYSKYLTQAWKNATTAKFNLGAIKPVDVGAFGGTAATVEINQLLSQLNNNNAALAQGAASMALGLSTASASQQSNAFDNVANQLDQWGLGSLAPMVLGIVTKAGDNVINTNAILDAIRRSPQYEAAFPGLAQHNATVGAGSEHLTEQGYQNIVQSYQATAGNYGLPDDFLTKAKIGQLIAGNVSPSEFNTRMMDLYAATQNADPAVKQALARQFGINQSQLLAYFADPTAAVQSIAQKKIAATMGTTQLQRAVAGAEIGDYATKVGLSGLTPAGASELADRARLAGATAANPSLATGVSTIENSLLTASKGTELRGSGAPGAGLPGVDLNSLIGSQIAGFGGTNQIGAQEAVDRAAAARAGAFDRGGGYDETQKGVVGVGAAAT